jgi:hypothetical protein
MLLNYTYERAVKMFALWLQEIVLYTTRKEALQQVWLRMETKEITFAFNQTRMVKSFALVFKGVTSSRNCTGNRD